MLCISAAYAVMRCVCLSVRPSVTFVDHVKTNSMLTNCVAACAHVTITVSEIERDIGRKSSIFYTALYLTPPLGASRRNIATPFGMEN